MRGFVALAIVLVTGCGDGATPGEMDASPAPATPDAGAGDAPAPAAAFCATVWPPATATAAGFPTEPLTIRVAGAAGAAVELGYGPSTAPPGDPSWRWLPAAPGAAEGEYAGTLAPAAPGAWLWAGRVSLGGGAPPLHCDRGDGGRAGSADGWVVADAPTLAVAAPGEVVMVSLNLRCLVDDWDARAPLVADAVAAAGPDLVGFQEVCAGGGRDNLAELLVALEARTGRPWIAQRAVTHLSWGVYEEGIALATPHPVAWTDVVALPTGAFPRKLVVARVVTPQGPLTAATTHLDHQSAAVRAAQAEAVVTALAPLDDGGAPVLLSGDMNEGPGGDVDAAYAAAGLADLWPALHPGEDGFTFPSAAPAARIDYVRVAPGASALAPAAIEPILATPVGGVYGSDHLGLRAVVTR